tara:strand:+ start:398 stop:760 length:363 start_codon:yes stop_codon:yes gene_type:complete
MNKQKQDSHLNVILANMCRYVEVNYWDIDFNKNNWFQEYEWNQETENNFTKWLSEYLYGVKGAQKELCARTSMRKKECEDAAQDFVFQYGWSLRRPIGLPPDDGEDVKRLEMYPHEPEWT